MDDSKGTLRNLNFYEGDLVGGINAVQSRHKVFQSLYSALSTTVPVEIPIGNGVVIKSDLPLIVRIGKKEPIRDVFDLVINSSLDYLSILPQVTGTFVDCQVSCYSIFPAKYLKRWQRILPDYPSVVLSAAFGFGVVDTAIQVSSSSFAPNPSNFILENFFIRSIYVRQTASTGAPASANFISLRIIDNQGAPQDYYWHRENTTITPNTGDGWTAFINPVNLVKVALPFLVRVDISVAAGAAASRQITVYLNGSYR